MKLINITQSRQAGRLRGPVNKNRVSVGSNVIKTLDVFKENNLWFRFVVFPIYLYCNQLKTIKQFYSCSYVSSLQSVLPFMHSSGQFTLLSCADISLNISLFYTSSNSLCTCLCKSRNIKKFQYFIILMVMKFLFICSRRPFDGINNLSYLVFS